MQIRKFSDAAAYHAHVTPFLCQREAEHNLHLGLLASMSAGRGWGDMGAYLAAVEDGESLIGVALRTDSLHNVLFSNDLPASALALLLDDLAANVPDLVGVSAEPATARTFAEAWAARMGQTFIHDLAMRIYRCDQVVPPQNVPGTMRLPRPDERERLIDWAHAFTNEALEPISRAQAEGIASRFLDFPAELAAVYLWEVDGEVVSQAAYSGPTPNGMRVNFVYTPPEQRGHGYASAVTAGVTQLLLDQGRQFCFLFTDLKNPTSNHIYQQIGYRVVSDFDQYRFSAG